VGLVVMPILSLFFIFQVCLFLKAKEKPARIKLKIHLSCLLSSVLMTLYSVDESNVYGIFPHLFYLFLLNASVSSVSGTLCLIIYCHFELQYSVDMKYVPRFIPLSLLITWGFFSIFLLLCGFLMAGLNAIKWDIIWEIAAMVYFMSIIVIDLSGYFTVRRTMQFNLRSKEELEIQLNRITRFHVFIIIAILGYISDCPYWIYQDFGSGWESDEHWYVADTYEDPDLQTYFFLFALLCYLWWAWIPLSVLKPKTIKTRASTEKVHIGTKDTITQTRSSSTYVDIKVKGNTSSSVYDTENRNLISTHSLISEETTYHLMENQKKVSDS